MPPSRSRRRRLAGRSAAESTMSSSARRAPRRSRLAIASTVATAPGSRRANASRQSTNDSSVTPMKRDRQHDDEVPERTGRASRPEMMNQEVRRDDDMGVQSHHSYHREAHDGGQEHQPRQQGGDRSQHLRVLASDVGRSEVPSMSHQLSMVWRGRITADAPSLPNRHRSSFAH